MKPTVRLINGGIRRTQSRCKTNVRTHFQNFAVPDAHCASFHAARLGYVARAGPVNRSNPSASSFAVVCGDRSGLTKGLSARFLIWPRSKNHMAPRNFIRVKPPVVGSSYFDAKIIVVGIRGADEQSPAAGKFVGNDTWFRSAQCKSDSEGAEITAKKIALLSSFFKRGVYPAETTTPSNILLGPVKEFARLSVSPL
jgi:hypothetical protein